MKVLISCEESQTVCKAFRAKGHEAYSCDILPCSGGHLEWHIQGDVLPLLNGGHFLTEAGKLVYVDKWDFLGAHPPCTFLSVSGIHWNNRGRGWDETNKALDFVRALMDAPIEKMYLENPVSIISSRIRKPDQIIQPFEFGHDASKKTCLWLKNLPPLIRDPEMYIEPRFIDGKPRWGNQTDSGQNKLGPSEDRAAIRSKTYEGIARAFANQYG